MSDGPEDDYEDLPIVCYMCKTEFDHELLNGQTSLFPTIKELKEKLKCTEDCGVVEVEIRLVSVVQPSR